MNTNLTQGGARILPWLFVLVSACGSEKKADSAAISGVCGASHGQDLVAAPSGEALCSSGKASAIDGTGPWTWTCTGSNGGSDASCSAKLATGPVNGTCGSSNGKTSAKAPSGAALCSAGTASQVQGAGPWTWTCAGLNGGTDANCSAELATGPVNGACGSANGQALSSAPSEAGLCSAGTASQVQGAGPWTWTCAGVNGGTTASCATRAADTCAGVTCSNHGVCNNGTCLCNSCYTGSTCGECAAGCSPVGDGCAISGLNPKYWDADDIPELSVPESTTGKTIYVDGARPDDSGNGLSEATAKKTIAAAVKLIAPGDTVRIKAGHYYENLSLDDVSGTAAKPITLGPFGNGEVILDGSQRLTWTLDTGRVWKATVPSGWTPGGIVVDAIPLKEVNHGQCTYPAAKPAQGRSTVQDNTGKWFFDTSSRTLYADMGTAIEAGDPNQHDTFVVKNDGKTTNFFSGDYFRIYGLTMIGNSGPGIWGYGNYVTVERCNIKFNYKQGISWEGNSGKNGNTSNQALYNHVYFNCLNNWPRANNDYGGGGWNQGISGNFSYRMVARGNVVAFNGGEGIGSYGSAGATGFGEALIEGNIVHDNWAVNVYIDNQPGGIIRNNFIYNKDHDLNDLIGNTDPDAAASVGRGISANGIGTGDEGGSAVPSGYAYLANTSIYNNLIVNCRKGVVDFGEGLSAAQPHGLKNHEVHYNTIITPKKEADHDIFGIEIGDNGSANSNSHFTNNIVVGMRSDAFLLFIGSSSLSGITLDYNIYYNPSSKDGKSFLYGDWTVGSLAQLQQRFTTIETHGAYTDPGLIDVNAFNGTGSFTVASADLSATSPARDKGECVATIATDFNGTSRQTTGNTCDIGFLEH